MLLSEEKNRLKRSNKSCDNAEKDNATGLDK